MTVGRLGRIPEYQISIYFIWKKENDNTLEKSSIASIA